MRRLLPRSGLPLAPHLPGEEDVLTSGLELETRCPSTCAGCRRSRQPKGRALPQPSLHLLCVPAGCLSGGVRTCVLVRVHLTDLKQVCKTRLPPRLKGSRATQDLGGQGEGNICSKTKQCLLLNGLESSCERGPGWRLQRWECFVWRSWDRRWVSVGAPTS